VIVFSRTKKMFWVPVSGMISLAAIGCSPATMAKVSGTVTSNGKPVPDAVVQFVAHKGPGAVGRTDATGQFSLSTLKPGDGAFFGTFQVTVQRFLPGEDPDNPSPSPPPPNDIPKVYRSAATTPLSAEVKRGAKNAFDFELSSERGFSK
jgi:hypothetical protein